MTETVTLKRKDLTVDAEAEQKALQDNILACTTLHIDLGEADNKKIVLTLEADSPDHIRKAKQCIDDLGFVPM